ncbi:MAG: HAD family phosphatase [Pseudomonadota bacterium]
MRPSRALLFDLDGTLLHSDPIHEAVYREIWAQRGLVMADGFYKRHVHGRLNTHVFAEFLPDEPDPQGLSDAKEAAFRERLPRPYPATPGLGAFLDRAEAAGWAMAIVTNAQRLNAEAMLEAVGERARFEVIVCGEESLRAKPDPYPYTQAMALLGVSSEAAIAFEDSATGLASAVGSGAHVVAITSSHDKAALKAMGAHDAVADFTDPSLERLLAGYEVSV